MWLNPMRFPRPTRRREQAAQGRCRGSRRSAIAACALLVMSAVGGRAAETDMLRLRCANLASGANWPVVVDLDRSRVDSFPATITDRWVSWRDPHQGFFDLERATGELQMRNASSTGGYFMYYKCRRE